MRISGNFSDRFFLLILPNCVLSFLLFYFVVPETPNHIFIFIIVPVLFLASILSDLALTRVKQVKILKIVNEEVLLDNAQITPSNVESIKFINPPRLGFPTIIFEITEGEKHKQVCVMDKPKFLLGSSLKSNTLKSLYKHFPEFQQKELK